MLSVWSEGTPPDIPAPFNMAAHVLARGATCPDAEALRVVGPKGARSWRYGEIDARVRRLAAGMLAMGSRPGDRILIRLGNVVDYPLAYLAAMGAGLVPVPTSPQLTPREVAKIVDIVTPRLTLRTPDIAGAPGGGPELAPDEVADLAAAPLDHWHMGDPERPGYIVFTSGTGGQQRAVVHAHRAILARQMMIRDWYALTASDRLLHAGAFNWTFTMGTGLMDPWTVGACALILEPGTDLAEIPAILEWEQVTIFAAAPGVYRRILRHSDSLTLPALRHALAAGEKLPEALLDAWRAATGTEVHEAFGMSECSTFISGAPHRPAAPGCLGQPQRGRRVAIIGEDGAPVPIGAEGIIAVHRADPGLMLGYLGAPEETAARFRGDWFLTGDQGAMRPDGQVEYHGRADDMMNAGGFRVSPLEVEEAMAGCPGIGECAAFEQEIRPGVTVIALAYTAPAPLADTDLRAFAAGQLARYKQPRVYHHVPELPRSANGKISRRAIRAQMETSR